MSITRDAIEVASSLPIDPKEVPDLAIIPYASFTSPIDVHLDQISPTSSTVLVRIPLVVHVDRPLELKIAKFCRRLGSCTPAQHVRLLMNVTPCTYFSSCQFSVPIALRLCPSDGDWVARALVHPATWADAASVTVVALTLAGRPLTCDALPATLRVGYNHTAAPALAVYRAAKVGDVPALQAALDAGGSTEEADGVGGGRPFS